MIDGITGWITGMLSTEGTVIVLVVLFIIFIVAVKKLFQVLFNYLLVGIAGALFPLFASFIGINIPLTFENIIYFASSAILLYSVYLFGRLVYKVLSGIESIGKRIIGKNKKVDKLSKKIKELEKKRKKSKTS